MLNGIPTALRIERCAAQIALDRERIAYQASALAALLLRWTPKSWTQPRQPARQWSRWLALVAPLLLPLARRHRWVRRGLRALTYWRFALTVWRTARTVIALRLSDVLAHARSGLS